MRALRDELRARSVAAEQDRFALAATIRGIADLVQFLGPIHEEVNALRMLGTSLIPRFAELANRAPGPAPRSPTPEAGSDDTPLGDPTHSSFRSSSRQ